jgi:hypothetical protein
MSAFLPYLWLFYLNLGFIYKTFFYNISANLKIWPSSKKVDTWLDNVLVAYKNKFSMAFLNY